MLFASYQFGRKATAFLDQEADLSAYPDQCPPEKEVTLLTLGMDEHGHKLRLLVDGGRNGFGWDSRTWPA